MIQFHCDLDNTLIYSYKHELGANQTCVEVYQDREISFMLPEWIESIRKMQGHLLFVPTTTRTIEQYERIDMGIRTPEFALVCNGGVLLRNGRRDEAWYQESLELVRDSGTQLKKAAEILEGDMDRCFDVRVIEDLFIFTKSNAPERTVLYLRERLDVTKVDIFYNGIKVYVVPQKLSKGNAVVRLKKLTGAERIVCAGDSEFDRTMLLAADIGICPAGFFSDIPGHIREYPKEMFTQEMLCQVENLLQS